MAYREKRSEVVAVRLEPRFKRAVQFLAEREHRTMSQQIRMLVIEALKPHRGALPLGARRRPTSGS